MRMGELHVRLVPALAVVSVLAMTPAAYAGETSTTRVREVSAPVSGQSKIKLPITASHIAVHWREAPSAKVRIAIRDRSGDWTRERRVALDEAAEGRQTRETYGAVMPVRRATAVRLSSNRRLSRATVVAMADKGPDVDEAHEGQLSAATASEPPVTSRSEWGADESLRFDADGNEKWAPAFYPTQKLIVHHTAGVNNDPDPPATVRSIYYYHAVTQGFGDIGYNLLVDESGRVYEGRYSREYATGESPSGEDSAGNGVTGAHAQGFNSGTAGVALLGTLTDRDATAAARGSLEDLLAWKAERNGIDPQGSSLFTNPVSGEQKTFPNIAGHRDVGATECPGGLFYGTLPELRQAVAARLGSGEPAPTTERYRPLDYAVAAGSVYNGRGDVARLFEDDGSRVEVTAGKSGRRYFSEIRPRAVIEASERASLRRLAVDYDGHASASGVAMTLRLYNHRRAAWETLDGPRTGVTADRPFRWSTSASPTDYVSADGEIRFSVRGERGSSFRTKADHVRFEVEY